MSTPTLDQQLAGLRSAFADRFGRPPRFAAVAPGRVNLIGEHTDYNDGFVLPMAIQRQTLIVADTKPIRRATIASAGQAAVADFALDPSLAPGQPKWSNYVRGVFAGFIALGHAPPGLDAMIDSTVPLGGGLSSSAALEVATATLLEQLLGKTLDPIDKALLCQTAEHRFAGMPCGIMDQFISTLGRDGHAMLLDCRSRQTRMVPLSDPGVSVLIANTHVKHELTGGEYAQRRAQCEAAAKTLGVPALRDADPARLDAVRAGLDPLTYRRARHVVTEIERTARAADAMTDARWAEVGNLMNQSHDSLRDDFEVSCDELDVMVEEARRLGPDGGVYGSRMTGGGFGGCTVSLVRTDRVQAITDAMTDAYQRRTGIRPTLFASRPAQGARPLEL